MTPSVEEQVHNLIDFVYRIAATVFELYDTNTPDMSGSLSSTFYGVLCLLTITE